MTSILILGIVQAVFLSLLILNKKDKGKPDYVLATLLVYSAAHLVFFLANFNDHFNPGTNLLIVGSGFPLLSGPMLYWYVLSLIRRSKPDFVSYLTHSTPYIIYCAVFLYYGNLPGEPIVKVYDGFMHYICCDLPWPIRYYSSFFALSGGGYPTACIVLLAIHNRRIKNEFSYEEKINLLWLRNLILFTIFTFLITFFTIYFTLDSYINMQPKYAFYVTSCMITIYVFFMGYFGLRQANIFTDKTQFEPVKRYQRSGLDNKESSKIIDRLSALMKNEKPFLNPKLNLNDLAIRLEISKNHLSQAINENLEKNFFDYVNEYRVEEVKIKLQNPANKHLTLLGIALDSGFSSKSSFNHIFKKVIGKTPSEYKKSM
ncbi:MAG: AraC family transcriptional regulator [Bacteroidota bacterium]